MTGSDQETEQAVPSLVADAVLACEFSTADLYSLRAAVSAHATEHGMGAGQLGKLLVVVTELAANAIRHGGGQGRLRLWRDRDVLHCEVTDDGPGIHDPEMAGVGPVPPNGDSGRGLWIVRQFSDQVTITGDHNGTRITALLKL